MKLLGEEIYTEVPVLASLSGRRDTNDLTWTALQYQEVTNTDVVAWNCDGAGGSTTALGISRTFTHDFAGSRCRSLFVVIVTIVVIVSFTFNDNLFPTVMVATERMQDTISRSF